MCNISVASITFSLKKVISIKLFNEISFQDIFVCKNTSVL